MKIVILGAGKVGLSIIENFIDDESDIVVVDEDQEKLDAVSEKYDLLTIQGSATNLSTLDHAGLKSANLILAVTDNDEVNILACKIANDIYNVQFKIARLKKRQYLEHSQELFKNDIFPVDYIIEPTQIMAQSIYNLIKYPGTESFTYFGNNNEAAVFSIQAQYGGVFIGCYVLEAYAELYDLNITLVAVIRNGSIIKINKSTIINAGDIIVLCSEPKNVILAISHFQRPLNKPKRIMLAGGSKINYYLANMLSDTVSVKIIESDPDKVLLLSNELTNCLIIEGDCIDENLLFDERIDKTDLFVAATEADNINVLTCVLAKRLGSKRSIALIGKTANRSLIHNEEIDIIYSGKNDIATELRSRAHITNYNKVFKDSENNYQIAEFEINNNLKSNELLNNNYKNIKLPNGLIFVGVINKTGFKVVNAETSFNSGDQIIMLCTEPEALEDFVEMNFKPIDEI